MSAGSGQFPDSSADPLTSGLDLYIVGGAVRDRLLGQPAGDRDFVVVGATPEEMIRRGFRPVGRDFPVFVHPQSGEEYALARTERKSGRGYHGFVFHTGPEVSLSEDLARRDLTINAIAEAPDGRLIDPHGGVADLRACCLRHVSPAFREDPVRLLRLARFAARFEHFEIAPDTLALCRQMVADGEIEHLVAERVWNELAGALMTASPSRFFRVLRSTGALAVILPELDALFGIPQDPRYHPEIDTGEHVLMVLDQAARLDAGLESRFACLVHDLGKGLTPADQLPAHHGHERSGLAPIDAVCRRLRVPNACRDMALLVGRWHLMAHQAGGLRAATLLQLLEHLDVFRRPERLEPFLLACEADRRGRLGSEEASYPQARLIRQAATAARAVPVEPLLARGLKGEGIAHALRAERIRAIKAMQRNEGQKIS